jgi:hypothetical protein
VSFETRAFDEPSTPINSRSEVLPARLTARRESDSAAMTAAATPDSAAEPMTAMREPVDSAIDSAAAANRSGSHCLARLFVAPGLMQTKESD